MQINIIIKIKCTKNLITKFSFIFYLECLSKKNDYTFLLSLIKICETLIQLNVINRFVIPWIKNLQLINLRL